MIIQTSRGFAPRRPEIILKETVHYIRVFHSLYKVGRNGNFVFKGFNNSKKKVTSSGAQPGARDYYWFRSSVPNQPNQMS